jgi:Glyoxalase-like domain
MPVHRLIGRAACPCDVSAAVAGTCGVPDEAPIRAEAVTHRTVRRRLAALEAECARLVELGSARVRLLPAADGEESCIVMQDIEGNEFCLD